MKARTRYIGAAALVVLLVVGAWTLQWARSMPVGAVFQVGDRVMTSAEFDQRVRLLGVFYGVAVPRDPGRLDRFHRDTAKAVAISTVQENAARDQGMTVPDRAVDDQLASVIDKSFPGGQQVFEQKLAGIGLDQTQVRDEVRRQLLDARLFDQQTRDVPVPTDRDVEAAYRPPVAGGPPLDQVREQVRAELLADRRQDAYNTWLSATLRAADVRYADSYRPPDPEDVTR